MPISLAAKTGPLVNKGQSWPIGSFNVGLMALFLSLNAGSKSLCLQVEAILFVGYYT